jgi:hypothetical protein
MARKRSSVEDFVIDFSKEEGGTGGGIRVKPGRYRVKIVAAKPDESSNKKTPMLVLTLQILDGKYKGKKLTERLYATTKAFSRFRFLLSACGKKSPSKVNLARIANAVKGCIILVDVDDEDREGYKTRSKVDYEGFYPEDYADDDEADDEEDDDLDDEEDDEDEDDLEDDLEDDDEEDDEPEPPKRKKKSKSKKRRRDDEDDDDELDLDEL